MLGHCCGGNDGFVVQVIRPTALIAVDWNKNGRPRQSDLQGADAEYPRVASGKIRVLF